MNSDLKQVIDVVEKYFRLMNTYDLSLYDEIFSEDARLYGWRDGKHIVWSAAEYRDIIAGREAPSKQGEALNGDVFNLSVMSSHQATAVVKVSLSGTVFHDSLTFFRGANGWRIVAKTFTVEAQG